MIGGRRNPSASAFNEGIEVPRDEWAKEIAKNPALDSNIREERQEATRKSILTGSLAKYRRR